MRTRRSTAFVKRCLTGRYVPRDISYCYISPTLRQMVACDNAECTYQWVSSLGYIPSLFPADVCVISFISPVSTLSRPCRRCGTAPTVFRRVWPAVWIFLVLSARRNARDRKGAIVMYCSIITTTSAFLLLLSAVLQGGVRRPVKSTLFYHS